MYDRTGTPPRFTFKGNNAGVDTRWRCHRGPFRSSLGHATECLGQAYRQKRYRRAPVYIGPPDRRQAIVSATTRVLESVAASISAEQGIAGRPAPEFGSRRRRTAVSKAANVISATAASLGLHVTFRAVTGRPAVFTDDTIKVRD